MSRVLGEAFVVLRPDATDFRADATAKIKAATQGINPNVNLGVNLNTAQLAAKTAAVKAAMSSLGGVNLGVNLNDDTLGSVAGLESRLAVVRNSLQNMPVTIDDATSIAKLASLQVQAAKLDESLKNMSPGMNAGPAAAQLLGLEASMKRLTDDQGALAESADGMTHVYGMWTTVISALRGHISLFGGALEGLVPEFLASVSGFHLLTEGIIETTAVWAPAIIGLAAFGIAAEKTFQQIVVQMTNLNTVSNALGVQMPGLSGDFAKVQAAVKPEAIQLFGEALLLANKNGGTFGAMAVGVGHDLDQLASRFTLAMDNKAVGQFAQATTADFAGLGTAIGNFGGIIGNLMKAVPGYAHILLGFGTEALSVGENITAIGEPIVALGLKAHGALVYAGLLGTLLAKLAGGSFSLAAKAAGGLSTSLMGVATAAESSGFTKISSAAEKASYGMSGAEGAASKLSNISWGWVGIGVAGLILLDKWMGDVTTQAQAFVQNWESVIQNAPIGQVMTENAAALAATDIQLNKATTSLHEQTKAYNDVTSAQDKSSASIDKSGQGLAANRSGMNSYSASTRVATQNVQTLTLGQQQFEQQGKLVTSRLQSLGAQFGGTANAQGLLNAAGITTAQITDTNNQHWQQAVIQMEAQQAGFKEMEIGAGRYGAAMNALNNPLTTLDTNMSKITQAQSALMTTITGGESAFVTFQQGINTLGTDATASQSAMTGLSKSSSWAGLKSAAQQLGVSIAGVGTQSKAFEILETAAKNAQSSVGGLNATSLQMSSDFYTGVTNAQSMINSLEQQGVSTKNLTKVVATQASEMLQYAGNNVAARATVMSLINDAIGPGTTNFKNLDKWVSTNSTSLSTMNGIVATTTVNAAGASGAIDTMSQQIFDQQLMMNSQASPALKTYADDIEKYGANASQTKSARTQLIQDLQKTGISASTATGLVKTLTKGLNSLPSKVSTNITDSVTGNGTIKATQSITGQSSQMIGQLKFVKDGGLMTGGIRGRDSIPAMVMPGELIVPTNMVNAGAVDHLRGKLPGFAAGGLVGNGFSAAENALSQIVPASNAASALFSQNVGTAFAKAAQSSASASASASGGNVSGAGLSGTLLHMLEQFAAKVGWNDSQISAWEGVIQLESGGSFTAKNPGSDAYGLAQFIDGPGEYAQYGGNLTPSGQVTAMGNYIKCVTLSTMILTRTGWKSHDEVAVGDETIAYDPGTGTSRWTKITAVHHYGDAPLMRVKSSRVDLLSTPNHRWITEKYIPGTGGREGYRIEEMATTEKIGSRHRTRLAAVHESDSKLDITDTEAELLGWIASDGCVSYALHNKGSDKRYLNVSISQSKPQYVAELRELCADLPIKESTAPTSKTFHVNYLMMHTFRLSDPYARALIEGTGFSKKEPGALQALVLRMSDSQRAAFLAGLLKGDGYKQPDGNWIFTQNEGEVLDAFVLAATLEGHYCNLTDSAGQKHVTLGKPFVKFINGPESRVNAGVEAVWCVTTELGTWTAKQGGQVFLTGNSRYGTPSAALAHEHCVTLDAMILTRRGWLAHDAVKVGDETLGYNFTTGRNEWAPVTSVLHYEDAPLVRLSNKTWETVCTPNHRWVSEHWTRTGSSGPYTREAGFTEAQSLTSRHRIRVAAPADTVVTGPNISLQEAELLGWVMGDGSVAHPRGTSVSMRLYQSKPSRVKEIDKLVAGLPFNRYRRDKSKYVMANFDVITWEFRNTYSRELIERSGYEHTSPVDFVISLNAEQRTAFLKGMFGAEGWYTGGGAERDSFGTGKKYRSSKNYSQSDGSQQDALILALYLEGYRPGLTLNQIPKDQSIQPTKPNYVIRDCKPYLGGESIRQEDAGRGAVWCVTTGLGSWTMRQGRHVMLTGNSYHWYGEGGLVPRSKAHRGFAAGGVINEPVLGTGLSSGMSYSFGEGGRVENVTSDQNTNQNQPTHTGQNTTNQLLAQVVTLMQQQNQISQQTTNPAVGRSLRTTAIKR